MQNNKDFTVKDDFKLRSSSEVGWEGSDWIHLDQYGDQWWVIVSTVMNLRIQ